MKRWIGTGDRTALDADRPVGATTVRTNARAWPRTRGGFPMLAAQPNVLAGLLVVALASGLGAQAPTLDRCGTMPHLQALLQADPGLAPRMAAIEAHTQNHVAANPPGPGPDVVFTIPVVVHIVFNSPAQNLSDAQIQSQITVLNEDFRRTNPDAGNTPAVFLPVAADAEFQFCLAARDPQGLATTGITRTSTSVTSFGTNNAIKFTAQGGRDAWPRDQYMNLWVGPLSGGLLGYAQFPGGGASTDGVVIAYDFFGRFGTAQAPFNLGRTATHEVGHWLNLRHIWGDNEPSCGDDLVADTPQANNPHFNCQTGIVSCGGQNMVENYMDYSDDACFNIFTQGQKTRMRALFATGGSRQSLLQSQGCTPPAGSCPSETGEPNNTCAAAAALTPGATVNRFVCPANDMDWYSFTLGSSQQVTVTMVPPQSPCLDYDVQLFSACGTFLGFSANTGCATETINAGTLAAGTYRVVVMGASGANSSTAAYALTVTATTGTTCPSETGEPNGTCATASALTPGTAVNRFICPANDQDWYSFTLAATQQVTVTMVPPQSPCLDYDVQLFSTCGSFLGFSANTGCATETIAAGSLAAGTYRVVVIGAGGASSSTASYNLNVTATTGTTCPSESGEPNGTCATATGLPTGTTVNRFLCPSGDVDWYSFTLAATQQVTVTMVPPQSPCLDYDVQLFSSCGTFLGFSANTGCATETINAGSLAAGTYRVVVVGAGGASSATASYALTVTATTGTTCPSESGEPNGTCATATALTPGTPINRFLCPSGDLDWYSFTLAATQQVTVSMAPPATPCLDYDVQLFSSCGTFLGFSANTGCAAETIAAGSLAAGTYRVVVIGAGGASSATASYGLTVTATTGPTCPSETGEPNATCATATALTPGATINRFLCPSGDLDWYSFTLAATQTVTVAMAPPQSPCLDYDIQLFSSCGTFLGFSANTGCASETINAGPLAAGTYRLVVIGVAGASSGTASYGLTVTATTGPTCPSEAGEPNGTCATATSLTPGTAINRFLCPANDLDWYAFTLAATQSVTVTMTPPQSPCLDYDIQLFSSCGTFLGFSANTGCATETIAAGALAPGTYRIVVIGAAGANSSTASYALNVAAVSGGCAGDPGEPNDVCASATPLTPYSSVARLLCSGDVDWYSFTLASAQTVTVTLEPPFTGTNCLNYDLQLFSSCGTFLGFSAAPTCNTELVLPGILAAGTYRVVVLPNGAASFSATAPYLLEVTAGACAAEPGEPNESCAAASPISSPGTYTRYICTSTDQDWFVVTVPSGTVELSLLTPSNPCLTYDLRVFSTCGTQLSNTPVVCGYGTAQLTAGTYRIGVSGSAGAFSTTVPYVLTLSN